MLKLNDIISKIRTGIQFQRSEVVDDQWTNETVPMNQVQATILPQSENDPAPSVFYNMWVQTHTSDEEFDNTIAYLKSKHLTIITSGKSIFTHKEDGEEVSNRFMVVSSQT